MSFLNGKSRPTEDLLALTPDALMRCINGLKKRYEWIETGELAKSVLGRPIPLVRMGRGNRFILYVGAHHGMEWLTSVLLLYFIDDFCDTLQNGRYAEGLSLQYILDTRTLLFVPMLNPDGVELAIRGAGENILAERQRGMNGGSDDFSHWQANARGVDLNHNYAKGFAAYKKIEAELGITCGAPTRYSGEYPESEPETAALASFIRSLSPYAIFTLHTQGEEIYCGGGEEVGSRIISMARAVAGLSGYRLCLPEGPAAYGGLTDWAVGELGVPSFTLECGKGENPLPPSSALLTYAALRRMFFYSSLL